MATFQDYREKIPIIQVAESLGYAVDLSKGRKSLEYKHPDGDAVIINNPNDSGRQMYYNRDGSIDRGSLIDFVANRLSRFNISYQSEAEGVNKVLSRLASEPQAYRPVITPLAPKPFSGSRYEALPADVARLHYLVKARHLTVETVEKFLPFIKLVRDTERDPAKSFSNIGFPLSIPGSDATVGYDLRNYGFKGVAAGSDRRNGIWIADFAKEPSRTKSVFFGENPIDIMSFCQLKKREIDLSSSVFVSFGGGISKNQIRGALAHWPRAEKHTLFDNDYQGKVYDVALAAAISGREVSFKKNADSLTFTVKDKSFEIALPKLSMNRFEQESGIRSGVHVHKARGAKDFNDLLHLAVEQKKNLKMKM